MIFVVGCQEVNADEDLQMKKKKKLQINNNHESFIKKHLEFRKEMTNQKKKTSHCEWIQFMYIFFFQAFPSWQSSKDCFTLQVQKRNRPIFLSFLAILSLFFFSLVWSKLPFSFSFYAPTAPPWGPAYTSLCPNFLFPLVSKRDNFFQRCPSRFALSFSLLTSFSSSTVLAIEQVDHQLVGAHHDGRVGNLADEVGGKASIQRPVPFLSNHHTKSLEKWAVLAALLSQPGTDHLWKKEKDGFSSFPQV